MGGLTVTVLCTVSDSSHCDCEFLVLCIVDFLNSRNGEINSFVAKK